MKQKDAMRCKLCESDRIRVMGNHPDFTDSFIVKCDACKTYFTETGMSSEQLGERYQEDYRDVRNEIPDKAYIDLMYRRANAQYAFIMDPNLLKKEKLRVLEIGCGIGALLDVFSENATEMTGFEPDIKLSKMARERLQERAIIHPEPYDRKKLIRQRFDLIVLSHVLEHMIDPVEFLRGLMSLLDENGIVFIEVPYESPRSIREQIAFGVRGMMHLWFMQESALVRIVAIAGGTIVDLKRFGPSVLGFSLVPLNRRNTVSRLHHCFRNMIVALFNCACSRAKGAGKAGRDDDFSLQSKNGIWIRALVSRKK